MANLTAINFVEEFCQALDEGGDTFFSSGNDKKDMDIIIGTVKVQGYWAGNQFRYFFDMEKLNNGVIKLLSMQERQFGV